MRRGKRLPERSFMVYVARNSINQARLGLSVGRKACRLAYRRNLIKRVIREQFRQRSHTLPNIDIVFNVRNHAASLDRKQLNVAVARVFDRVTATFD